MHVARTLPSSKLATILRKCAAKVIYCTTPSLVVLTLLGSHPAAAYLPVRNQSPLTLPAGIPAMSDAYRVPANQQRYAVRTTASNNWYVKGTPGDDPYLDGETLTTEARFEFGFDQWALILDVPYLYHNGGFLDGFIEEYHSWFGLPNGSRDEFPKNRLDFRYNGRDSAELNKDTNGFGDLRVSGAYTLAQSATSAHLVTAQLKLNTGNSNDWLGSGGLSFGGYLTHHWNYWRMSTDLQYGLLWQQRSNLLPNQTQQLIGFLSLAFDFRLWGQWYAVAQYDGNTPTWTHSKQPPLRDAHMGTLGVRWQNKTWRVHGAVLEDLKVGSAPDVGFQLGFTYAPQ
ncbi:Uncharacterised protein [BD1-7 clade bacterium]|nr:Uncharacterised protein [BD1-7 clade bacterium]